MIRGPFLRHHVHGEIHSAGWTARTARGTRKGTFDRLWMPLQQVTKYQIT